MGKNKRLSAETKDDPGRMSCFYNGLAGAAAFGSLIVVSFFVPGIPWINAGSIALYVLGMKLSQMFLDGRTILFSLVKLLVIPAAILSVFSRIFQDPLYKDGLGHFNVIAIAVGELEPETDTILLHVHMDTVERRIMEISGSMLFPAMSFLKKSINI